MRWRPVPRPVVLIPGLLLAGCAGFSPDGGMSFVQHATRSEIGKDTVKITSEADARLARARIESLRAQPLTMDNAVQIALLNNRGLQAAYNELGISEADFVAASLPPNPRISLSRIAGGGIVETEFGIIANLLALFTIPARREIAEHRFSAAQHRAVEATFRLAADTRRAWIRAVAGHELAGFLVQARTSADTAADLMRRLGETGAANKLDQARAAAFSAEIGIRLAQARLRERAEREALVRLLGLWGEDLNIRLPASLPPLPRSIAPATGIEAEAIRKRVDLQMARRELQATAHSLGLVEATRYVSLLELGGMGKHERERTGDGTEKTTRIGPALEIEIPIFDLGETSKRRAQETYMAAVNRLAEKAVNVRAEARTAWQAYRATHDIARKYQTSVLPLRKIVSDEALLRYNGMLIDVFDLLTTAREQIDSTIAAIEARRDFLLAEVDFQAAIIGGAVH
jgi:outer membrane protein TolC